MREDGVHAMYDYFARNRGGEIAVVRLLLFIHLFPPGAAFDGSISVLMLHRKTRARAGVCAVDELNVAKR